jgi:hypothetical protein
MSGLTAQRAEAVKIGGLGQREQRFSRWAGRIHAHDQPSIRPRGEYHQTGESGAASRTHARMYTPFAAAPHRRIVLSSTAWDLWRQERLPQAGKASNSNRRTAIQSRRLSDLATRAGKSSASFGARFAPDSAAFFAFICG